MQTALGLVTSVAGQDAPATPIADAVLLSIAGQSNARKAGNSGGSPAAKYAALGASWIWDGAAGDWAAYVCGSNSGHRGEADSGAWGSEAEFLYRMRQSGDDRPVYIVKECVNGQSLAQSGGGDWSPQSAGERFDGYVAQSLAARASLAALGIGAEDVLLWNQGEADSNSQAAADLYLSNFEALLQALSDSGAFPGDGTVIVERIRPCSADLATSTYTGQFTVREAQERAAEQSARVRIVSLDFDAGNFASLHPAEPWTEGCGARCHAAWIGTYAATYGAVSDKVATNLGFSDSPNVAPGATILSEPLPLAGIGGHAEVSIAGGEYRVSNPDGTLWQDWSSATGTIHPYQSLQLRQVAAAGLSSATQCTVTVGGTSETWTVTTHASAPSLEPETEAFIAQVSANGGATITGSDADAIDALYGAAKGAPWWSDMLRLYLSLGDETASRLDLVDRVTSMADVAPLTSNAWAWSQGLGWQGLGTSNGGLSLQVAPATDLPQDNCSILVWYGALASTNRSEINDDGPGQSYLRVLDNGAARYLLNSSGNANVSGLTTATGMRAVVRDGPASLRLHGHDGLLLDQSSVASVAPVADDLLIGNPGGTYSDARILGVGVAQRALSAPELQAIAQHVGTLLAYFAV